MISTRQKTATAATLAVAVAVVTVLLLQHRAVERLRAEQTDLQARAVQLSQTQEALRRAASTNATTARPAEPAQFTAELLRLRGEVSRLQQPAEAFRSVPVQPGSEAEIHEKARAWNEGMDENSESELVRLERLIEKIKAGDPQTARYVLLFDGSLKDIANPRSALVIREKKLEKTTETQWIQSYIFADGHRGRIASETGDFSSFEEGHAVQLKEKTVGEPVSQ